MVNRVWWLVILCGCSSVRHVRVEPRSPLVLTEAEVPAARARAVKLQTEQPRTVARMTQAARLWEQVSRALPADYDAQWSAAAALAFVAENEANPAIRLAAAKTGLTLARRGRELRPDRVECHYWYALNVGLLADVDRSYGLNAVAEMETALKRAAEVDEKYDYAGPLRVLGILHLRTPAPPVSIGSSRKGLRWLERAHAAFPDYPENQLYLAEALRDNNRRDEAAKLVRQVINAAPWPDRQFESAGWKATARKLLESPPAP